MEVANISVERRETLGSRRVMAMRYAGKMPGVLYGGGKDSLPITLNHVQMRRHLNQRCQVYELEMGGVKQAGFLQEVQWDALTDEPLHVDLRRIELDEPLSVEIEISYLGHPKGASRGGVLVRDMIKLPLKALPAKIPQTVEVKVGELDLGDKIEAGQLELPEGCELDTKADALVCHMPGEAAVAAAMEQEAAADAADAAAAEADAPAEAGGSETGDKPAE